MLKRLGIAWLTVGRTFGTWVSPIGTFSFLMMLRSMVATGMAAHGHALRRPGCANRSSSGPGRHRRQPSLGHDVPPIGSSSSNNIGAGLRLWEMMFPSITLRNMIRPLLPLLEAISPARHHATVAHDTGLTSIETDDASMLFRYFDGFFLYGFIFAFAEKDYRGMFQPKTRATPPRVTSRGSNGCGATTRSSTRRTASSPSCFRSARACRASWSTSRTRRSSTCCGTRSRSSGRRSSLVTGVLDKRFGFWTLPEPTRARFIERLYGAFVLLLRTFHEDWVAGRVPKDRVKLVRFDRLMTDFDVLMDEILTFVGADKSACAGEGDRARRRGAEDVPEQAQVRREEVRHPGRAHPQGLRVHLRDLPGRPPRAGSSARTAPGRRHPRGRRARREAGGSDPAGWSGLGFSAGEGSRTPDLARMKRPL